MSVIAFDAATTVAGGVGTTLTWSHTCTGLEGYLEVESFSVGDVITGITYNGVAMTLVGKTVSGAGGNWTTKYALTAPATGAHNVVISASASVFLNGCASSYTGVKQTGQPEAFATASGVTAALAVSVTPLTANAWVLVSGTVDGGVVSSFTNGTSRANASAGAFFADNGPVVTPAMTTITVNSGGGNVGAVISSIAPAGGTGNMLELF